MPTQKARPRAGDSSGDRQARPVRITVSKEDYLKAIAEGTAGGETVIPATLARWLRISPPAVTAALRRLRRDGLVRAGKGAGVALTARGRVVANHLLLRHHLIERMLSEMFGMEWFKVHEEAERLEHAVSEDFERRLIAVLGEGMPCPHGNLAGGESPEKRRRRGWLRLNEVSSRAAYSVAAVDERDRQFLEFLDSLGLRPNARFTWLSSNIDDTVTLEMESGPCRVGRSAAAKVWVKQAPAA